MGKGRFIHLFQMQVSLMFPWPNHYTSASLTYIACPSATQDFINPRKAQTQSILQQTQALSYFEKRASHSLDVTSQEQSTYPIGNRPTERQDTHSSNFLLFIFLFSFAFQLLLPSGLKAGAKCTCEGGGSPHLQECILHWLSGQSLSQWLWWAKEGER